jgi:hypothetical protein
MNVRIIKFSLLASLFCLSANLTLAQDAIPAPPTCDKVLATTQADLQKQADATCTTATRCVACSEKKSGAVVYATLLAQPNCKTPPRETRANPSANTDFNKPNTVAKAADTRPGPPVFDIFQERCEDGSGVDLDVFIPGNAMECSKDQYSFLWEVDGGKGGHTADLKCACGKTAKLTVTNIKTGLSYTKRVELLPCGTK